MRKITALLGASALALGPSIGFTAPAYGQPAPGSISPHHETGQQVGDFVAGGGLECEDAGEGARPGSNSNHAPGPGNPFQEDSISGDHYAGNQPGINDKNTTSVSQYDIACFRGPNRP